PKHTDCPVARGTVPPRSSVNPLTLDPVPGRSLGEIGEVYQRTLATPPFACQPVGQAAGRSAAKKIGDVAPRPPDKGSRAFQHQQAFDLALVAPCSSRAFDIAW